MSSQLGDPKRQLAIIAAVIAALKSADDLLAAVLNGKPRKGHRRNTAERRLRDRALGIELELHRARQFAEELHLVAMRPAADPASGDRVAMAQCPACSATTKVPAAQPNDEDVRTNRCLCRFIEVVARARVDLAAARSSLLADLDRASWDEYEAAKEHADEAEVRLRGQIDALVGLQEAEAL